MSYVPARATLASLVTAAIASVLLFCGTAWADISAGEAALGSASPSVLSRIIDSVSSGGGLAASLPWGNQFPAGRVVAASADPETADVIEASDYTTLQEGIAQASDGSKIVKLTTDMTFADFLTTIADGNDVTIDFNGKTVTYNSDPGESMTYPFVSIKDGGKLTILGNNGKLIATNNATLAVYGDGILIIKDLEIVNADHTAIHLDSDGGTLILENVDITAKDGIVAVEAADGYEDSVEISLDGCEITATNCGIESAAYTGQVIVANSVINAAYGMSSLTDMTVTDSTITSTGDNAYGIDGYGAVELNSGSVTGKAGGINVRWDATINSGSVSGDNGAPAIVVTAEPGEEAPSTAINGGIFSTNPTGLDGVTIADGNVISQVTSGTNTGKFRVTPTDTTVDGWDLSAVSGTVTANGNRFPASDATISYAWGDGTNDKVTLNQTAEGSTEDGFYISWTKNNDNGGVSAQGLLFAASADDRPQDAGSYTGTIHGTGAYSVLVGVVQLVIQSAGGGDPTPDPIYIPGCMIALSAEFAYTGDKICPAVTVTAPDGSGLFEGVDYDLHYNSNLNPGLGEVRVEGKGKCTGATTKYFTIFEPAAAPAEPNMWGSCPWEISADGTLTIRAGTGADTVGKCPWADCFREIKKVVVEPGVVAPRNSSELFRNLQLCTSFDVSNLDVSNVAYFSGMFRFCKKSEKLDLSAWRTGSALDMSEMFRGCKGATSIDMSSFDTSKVTSIQGMFLDCSSLKKLDLRSFATAKVDDMRYAFNGCGSLKTIVVSDKWSVASAADGYWMRYYGGYMFENCTSLVGGAGMRFDASKNTVAMAHVDSSAFPGYLTSVAQDAAASVTPAPSPNPSPSPSPVKTQTMYRLYNKWSGEHLFTLSKSEYDSLGRIGWKQEGEAWKSPTSGTKVYRLYNRFSGDHHYTTSASEYATLGRIGWTQEGIGFYSGGSRKVYRGFNPYEQIGTHHYTIDAGEIRAMVGNGWRDEGVGWYCH